MRTALRCLLPLVLLATAAEPAIVTEGFDDLEASGWTIVNRSNPVGPPFETTSWFQGNPAVFPAHSGDPDSYAAASFTSAAFGGNISTWLISPLQLFRSGSTFSFYTRTASNPAITPDRLEVRFSNGGRDVGSDDTSVGDFGSLLLTVNPTLSPDGYPADWTQYSVNLTGADSAVLGRVAFRYAVPDTSVNGDYIGIDTVQYDAVPEPGTWLFGLLGLPILAIARRARTRHDRRTN